MNESHKLGKLKNRLVRCKKKLVDENTNSDQKSRIHQRISELETELNLLKK